MKKRVKKIRTALLAAGLLGIGAGLGYWYYQTSMIMPSPQSENPNSSMPYTLSKPEKTGNSQSAVPYVFSSPEPTKREGGEHTGGTNNPGTDPAALPDLDQSDDFVRQMIKDLSFEFRWADWIKIDHIIRVITAAVDNIATGVSPRPHLPFLKSGQSFSVKVKNGQIALDPESYKRYDLVADVFASLNTGRIIQVYLAMKPLFQQAYRDLGYPQRDFQETLIQAMKRLLITPTVKGDIALTEAPKGINYLIRDEFLENLSRAQKHLLRMGPKNTLKIQNKIREIALAMGVPEKELPPRLEYRLQRSP